jgi:hypothetical protein
MHTKITILTDPMPVKERFFKEWLFVIIRFIRDRVSPPKQNFNRSSFRGHPAVTRSLVEGLTNLGYSFNYNPRSINQLAKNVIVLSGIKTLKQAIEFKKRGFIKKLYAGPNIVVFSSDYNCIIASHEIDVVVTPCNWVVDLYLEDCPSLCNKIITWPAGVNTSYWRPSNKNLLQKQILVYEKQNKGTVGPIAPYVQLMRSLNLKVTVMKYGEFTHDQYLKNLNESILMIGFVTDESQGLAWAEAWSCDVPTFIWRNDSNVYQNRKYSCSTAPYLSDATGLFFDNVIDFELAINDFLAGKFSFTAREWVLKNMSDEVCAKKIYNHINQIC